MGSTKRTFHSGLFFMSVTRMHHPDNKLSSDANYHSWFLELHSLSKNFSSKLTR